MLLKVIFMVATWEISEQFQDLQKCTFFSAGKNWKGISKYWSNVKNNNQFKKIEKLEWFYSYLKAFLRQRNKAIIDGKIDDRIWLI